MDNNTTLIFQQNEWNRKIELQIKSLSWLVYVVKNFQINAYVEIQYVT